VSSNGDVGAPVTTAGGCGALSEFLARCLDRTVEVVELTRVEGGWSRQLHRVLLDDGTVLALRGELPVSLLSTDLEREYGILTALAGTGVPLPRMAGFEPTGRVLGHRFVAMEWVPGTCVNPWRQSAADLLGPPAALAALAASWIADIARLHGVDVAVVHAQGIDADVSADGYIRTEVSSWVRTLRQASNHPGPLVEEACRWLERHRPAGREPPVILHGDLRLGNMVVGTGRVAAFLDWEMAGVGDWRADLGYCLMPYNAGKLLAPVPPSANQLVPPRQFLATYLAAARRTIGDDELRYFIVLACLKMIAILCTGIDAYRDGRTRDPRLAWTSIAVPGLVDDVCGLLDRGLPW
jgi:aminoglycoside phosphotransferase (APT) family kinase protein